MTYANDQETHAFAREHDIDCDSYPCKAVDAIYDQDALDSAIYASTYLNDHITGVEKYEILSKEEIQREYLAVDALGGLRYDAGSINGYKFVVGVLELALKMGLNLQTNTPAEGISGGLPQRHDVKTSRGVISTRHVILATNGYTSHLYTPLQGVIVPLRGQMSAQRPGPALPHGGCLPATYGFIYENGYEYMMTRPKASRFAGDICIGGKILPFPTLLQSPN